MKLVTHYCCFVNRCGAPPAFHVALCSPSGRVVPIVATRLGQTTAAAVIRWIGTTNTSTAGPSTGGSFIIQTHRLFVCGVVCAAVTQQLSCQIHSTSRLARNFFLRRKYYCYFFSCTRTVRQWPHLNAGAQQKLSEFRNSHPLASLQATRLRCLGENRLPHILQCQKDRRSATRFRRLRENHEIFLQAVQ